MQVKKGDILAISHTRKGDFQVIATLDFDTEEANYFPVSHWGGDMVLMSGGFTKMEHIACRASFVLHCEIVGHVEEPEPGA